MTKNIEVVDEQGNVYGATYPKRAKGLVMSCVSAGDESITSICSAEDVDSDAIRAMVESVCDVYKMRTSTLEKSLSLYQQMLYDVSDGD